MEYSGAGGKLIHEKNQKQKISWHCPFKPFQIGRSGLKDGVSVLAARRPPVPAIVDRMSGVWWQATHPLACLSGRLPVRLPAHSPSCPPACPAACQPFLLHAHLPTCPSTLPPARPPSSCLPTLFPARPPGHLSAHPPARPLYTPPACLPGWPFSFHSITSVIFRKGGCCWSKIGL